MAAAATTATPGLSSGLVTPEDLATAKKFLAFNDGSSSVFHATLQAQKGVEAAGVSRWVSLLQLR